MKKIALIVAISAIVLAGTVKAYDALSGVQIDNIETANFILGGAGETVGESILGTNGDSNFTNVVAEGDITAGDALIVAGETSVQGLTDGSGAWATTTSQAAVTLSEQNLLDYNYISMVGNVGTALALTLPATSTMTTLLPNAGDHREWLIHNATSTSGYVITITKGLGIDLIGVTTNDDPIDGTEYTQLECYRQPDTNVTCITSELLHID